jgi:signal transduction histidine kinase/CheY-like chemotaxis protein
VAVGAAYLGLWLAGVAAHWSAAGVITMKANMALALVLAGVSLWLLEPAASTGRGRRVAGTLAAAAVLLMGALTLLQHLTGADLHIDQFLAIEPPGAVATSSPNRIGPPGSTSLVLLGAGLLALSRRRRIALYLGLAVCLVDLVPAVGLLYDIGQLYGRALTGIAWPTVVALLSLGLGLMVASGRDGALALLWQDDLGGAVLRRVLPPAVLIPVALGFLVVQGAHRGLYDPATGTGILTVALVLFLAVLFWRSAERLSAAAAERRRAETDLAAAKERLTRDLEAMTRLHRLSTHFVREGALQAVLEEIVDAAIAIARADAGDIRLLDPGSRKLRVEARRGRGPGSGPEGALEEHATPLVGSSGKVVGMLTIHTRGARQPDGQERRLLDVLARQTAEMVERGRAEEALRESDRRKGEFLAVLSHELRNPLGPIRNSLYVLERAPAGSEQAVRASQIIHRQTQHLTRLVDDLLDVTRISRGKVQLQRTMVDVAEVVRRTCEDLRAIFEERGIHLRAETGAEPLWVRGDATRLAQVVGNLLQNAAKFTASGKAVTASAAGGQGQAEIRVRDEGCGISPDLLPRIFEPFVQADLGLARAKGGLGLGLALVKGIVELHGGAVSGHSEGADRGAEFVVRLPLARAPEQPAAAPGGPARGAARGVEILVIEDNLDAAQTIADLLELEGHRVRVATDGRSGLVLARERSPDVVLCDIGLPDLDGYEVARTLRADQAFRSTRLVALSGYAQPEDRRRARESGFDAHLRKPPSLEELLQLLAPPG